jgi:4-hydroxybenzoyl-CoA reductase subunit alpha
MGWGMCEEQPTDNGMILNPSFADYKVIRTRDMPQIELHEVFTYDPEGPFGAKESAEGAVAPTPASIANAIFQLTGAQINSNVLKPEKVLNAIREAEKKQKKPAKK